MRFASVIVLCVLSGCAAEHRELGGTGAPRPGGELPIFLGAGADEHWIPVERVEASVIENGTAQSRLALYDDLRRQAKIAHADGVIDVLLSDERQGTWRLPMRFTPLYRPRDHARRARSPRPVPTPVTLGAQIREP